MKLSSENLIHLQQVAVDAATLAGQYIASSKPINVEIKEAGSSDASQVVTEVDKESQRLILEALQATIEMYDLGLLAEEDEDNGSRLTKDFFWCVDPLDGTLPFIEGRPGYAVAISLVSQSGTPHIGVVYNPVEHKCYSAIKGIGAWLNGRVWQPQFSNKHLTLLHHRSLLKHPQYEALLTEIEAPYKDLGYETIDRIYHGGAIMNAIWGIEHQPAYYFALPKKAEGGGCIWDYAATVCIYKALGYSVTDYYGNELHLNDAETIFMNQWGVKFSTVD